MTKKSVCNYTTEPSDRFVKLKYDAFHYIGKGETKTIIQTLGFRNKTVFECIASHQDTTCHSNITLEQIAELTGIGLTTVQRAVNELKDFTYEGKPIMEVKDYYDGKKPRNLYKILPNPLVSQFNEKVNISNSEILDSSISNSEKLEPFSASLFEMTKEQTYKEQVLKNNSKEELETMNRERMTNKQIVSYFNGILKDKGIDKKPNYPRLMKQMKIVEPLFSELINNDIKKVCEIVADQYETWGNNSLYPLEVSVIARRWVVERALKELKKEKESVSQMKEQSVEATKRNDVALSSIMARIKRKGGQR
ncbi:hypothetical protein ABES03_08550 [Neobacillus rhizosphaerae]|uniref:hypothetical protein n=1 Tax=Neobacillus rhizosphaerae TaxID=2880965 RepID=UPI003D28631B